MRVLGVDFGTVRIGLALSDPTGTIASPYEIVRVSGFRDAVSKVLSRVEELDVSLVVVGIPLLLSGRQGEMAAAARRFAASLRNRASIPIEMWDERFSTKEASSVLARAGLDTRARRGKVDAIAACLVLQSYLDGRRGRNDGKNNARA